MSQIPGYEVSTAGDRRFSALVARLSDGRTIEEAYQLDVKGYRKFGDNWRIGKGKAALIPNVDLHSEYLALWRQWARENPDLIDELRNLSEGKQLTDKFARRGRPSQAIALSKILEESSL